MVACVLSVTALSFKNHVCPCGIWLALASVLALYAFGIALADLVAASDDSVGATFMASNCRDHVDIHGS